MRFLCAHACTHLDRLQPSQLSADHLLILPTNILNLPLQLYQCPLHNLGALPPHRNQHFHCFVNVVVLVRSFFSVYSIFMLVSHMAYRHLSRLDLDTFHA